MISVRIFICILLSSLLPSDHRPHRDAGAPHPPPGVLTVRLRHHPALRLQPEVWPFQVGVLLIVESENSFLFLVWFTISSGGILPDIQTEDTTGPAPSPGYSPSFKLWPLPSRQDVSEITSLDFNTLQLHFKLYYSFYLTKTILYFVSYLEHIRSQLDSFWSCLSVVEMILHHQ